jgi:hypothetical protein
VRFKSFMQLNEMIVIGKPVKRTLVVAFDKWIWLIDMDLTPADNEKIFLDIIKKLGIDQRDEHDNFIKNFDFEDTGNFISSIQEYKSDILVGTIYGKDLQLQDFGMFPLDPKSSVLVKKVVNQLGLKSATYPDDVDSTERTITKKKMTGQTGPTGYHGTATKYLRSILSKGLRPMQAGSNYQKQGIEHQDLIFFSTRLGEAMHHAVHTAVGTKSLPVIIEFAIPDKDLVVADYDVEKMTGKDIHYRETGPASKGGTTYKTDPDKVSREVGVYGYHGNVNPIFIKYIYVSLKDDADVYNIEKDFKKMKPKAALRYMEMMDY